MRGPNEDVQPDGEAEENAAVHELDGSNRMDADAAAGGDEDAADEDAAEDARDTDAEIARVQARVNADAGDDTNDGSSVAPLKTSSTCHPRARLRRASATTRSRRAAFAAADACKETSAAEVNGGKNGSMELPWYAYVFFAVAIAMFVAQIALKAKGAAKQLRRAAKSYRRSETAETDPKRLFALAIGAINGEQLTANLDSLETGIDRQRIVEGLSENWGIDSPDSARSTIGWLLSEGHRVYFKDVVAIARAPKNTWKQAVQKFGEPDRVLEYVEHWSETEEELRTAGMLASEQDVARGILSWDVGRAINVARMAYDAGYLSKDEAWSAIEQAAVLAKPAFSSWEELAHSYILGRAMWSGSGMMLDGLVEITKKLLVDAESPWTQIRWA